MKLEAQEPSKEVARLNDMVIHVAYSLLKVGKASFSNSIIEVAVSAGLA